VRGKFKRLATSPGPSFRLVCSHTPRRDRKNRKNCKSNCVFGIPRQHLASAGSRIVQIAAEPDWLSTLSSPLCRAGQNGDFSYFRSHAPSGVLMSVNALVRHLRGRSPSDNASIMPLSAIALSFWRQLHYALSPALCLLSAARLFLTSWQFGSSSLSAALHGTECLPDRDSQGYRTTERSPDRAGKGRSSY
jgi:hypothetical protein